MYGWGGLPEEEISFIGYKNLGNNIYELYSYLVNYNMDYEWDCDQLDEVCYTYDYSEDDVLGEDYIIDYISYIDEDGKQVETRYAVKLVGYTKSKVIYDGEFVKYLSYERLDKDAAPNISELETEPTPAINIKTVDVNVNAPEGAFIEGTKITVEKQTEGNIFDIASKALKEKFSSFVIYEINAKVGEYDVEPNGKVEISIKVPEGYKKPVVYYVSEDGKIEKLETKVEEGYAKAYVTHFSTYALVDDPTIVDKVVESVVENPKTGVACGVGGLAIVATSSLVIYSKSKKKNKFPQA